MLAYTPAALPIPIRHDTILSEELLFCHAYAANVNFASFEHHLSQQILPFSREIQRHRDHPEQLTAAYVHFKGIHIYESVSSTSLYINYNSEKQEGRRGGVRE